MTEPATARSCPFPADADRETHSTPVLLARAEQFAAQFDRIAKGRENPLNIVIEDTTGPVQAVINGRPTLMFGTNSYLGLNFHPDCIAAAVAAAQHYGTGSTASRVAAGNHRLHVQLEEEIAAFHRRSDAVVFSTGFMVNLGVITALARKEDAIFADAHCHASIFDACRLSGAQVSTFRHNDAADLERLFTESDIASEQTLVIVEGLYSVRGDVGALAELAAVAKRRGAVFVVDEAHGLGVYGRNGRGVGEHLGVEDDIDVVVGTFSKSVGVIGGYAVSNTAALRALRFMARPYLYTASLPLPVVAAARAAIALIASDRHGLRASVWRNARQFHAGVSRLGLPLHSDAGPVGSIRLPGLAAGYAVWQGLLARGIYVNLLVPPATPDGEVVLRFSVSAAHKPQHIDAAISAFREVKDSVGLG